MGQDSSNFAGAIALLTRDRGALVARWLERYRESLLRLPRPVDLRELSSLVEGIAAELGTALAEPDCRPGAPGLRELEKRIAFAGGHVGTLGANAFDVAALLLSLRDLLLAELAPTGDDRARLSGLFDWLLALAFEGYVTSREEALRIRHRDSLERGTPVLFLSPELPAVFLVGDPDRPVLESAFGRLLLCIVRVGAKAVVLDAGGLVQPVDPQVLDALGSFAAHKKVAGALALFVVGLTDAAAESWQKAIGTGTEVRFLERFDDAQVAALERAGYGIVKKRA